MRITLLKAWVCWLVRAKTTRKGSFVYFIFIEYSFKDEGDTELTQDSCSVLLLLIDFKAYYTTTCLTDIGVSTLTHFANSCYESLARTA